MGGTLLRFFTIAAPLCLAACGAPVFDLSIDGARQSFNQGARISVQTDTSTATIVFSATNDPSWAVEDDDSSMRLTVRVDRRQFGALSRGARLPIGITMASTGTVSGRGPTTLDMYTPTPGAAHTSAINAMLIERSCFCGNGPTVVTQQFTGAMTLDRAGDRRVHVRIEAQMDGVIATLGASAVRTQVLVDGTIDDPGL